MAYGRHFSGSRMYGTSYGGRRSGNNPCASIVVGFVLFVAAFPTIWWNEGRSVDVFSTLNSLEHDARSLDAGDERDISEATKNNEVAFVNDIVEGERLVDENLGVTIANAVSMRRKSQMYQWQEKKSRKKSGGTSSSSQVVAYSYHQAWSDKVVDSSRFSNPYHQNPTYMPVENREWIARKPRMGKIVLGTSLVRGLNDFQPLPMQPPSSVHQDQEKISTSIAPITKPTNLPTGYSVESGVVVNRPGALYQPKIGDVKVEYQFIPGGVPVSAFGKLTRNGILEPIRTGRGNPLPIIKLGDYTASELIALAVQENTTLTWLLRGAGFAMLLFGLLLVFSPVTKLLGHVWIVGSILNLGIFFAAFLVSVALWTSTFALAWLFYRPILSITGFAIAACAFIPFGRSSQKGSQ